MALCDHENEFLLVAHRMELYMYKIYVKPLAVCIGIYGNIKMKMISYCKTGTRYET